MLGKSLIATGKSSSMNGTMTKTEKGISRRRSCVVRLSWVHEGSTLVRQNNMQKAATHLTTFSSG